MGARDAGATLLHRHAGSGFLRQIRPAHQSLPVRAGDRKPDCAGPCAAQPGAATVPLLAASFLALPGYVPGDSPHSEKATLGYAGVLREGPGRKENLADKISTGPGSDDTAKGA